MALRIAVKRASLSLPLRPFSTSRILASKDSNESERKPFMKDIGELAYRNPHYGKEFSSEVGMPDTLGESVGSKRYEMLSNLFGDDDPFELKTRVMKSNNSKEKPNYVPSIVPKRLIGCVCEPEATGLVFMFLYKDLPTRCKCGNWFKLVDYKTYYQAEARHMIERAKVMKGKPETNLFLEEMKAGAKALSELETRSKDASANSPEMKKIMEEQHEQISRMTKLEKDFYAKYF